MGKIIYVEGDLFKAVKAVQEDDNFFGTIMVPHVCNNSGAWGAGFVVPLGKEFPYTRKCYLDWYDGHPNDNLASYLGTDNKRFVLGATQEVQVASARNSKSMVYNMIAQAGIGGKRPLRYDALAKCMDHVREAATKHHEPQIHAPLFGAGLAGGNWDFIAALIEDTWLSRGVPVTIYYLKDKVPPGWTPPEN